MRSRVTIKSVAESCGLSIPSVSQILNGKGSYHVDTRERVQAAAQKMGYRPNAYAQSMQSGRFNAAALVVATTAGLSYFEPELVLALEDRLAATNRHLVIARLPDDRLTDAGYVPRILRELMVDGLLIAYNAQIPPRMLELIQELNLPSIFINNNLPENSVHPDDFNGIKHATEHLIALGHRHIAYADFGTGLEEVPWHYSSKARRDGYLAAMAASGLQTELWSEAWPMGRDDRLPYALTCLGHASLPTAVISYNTETAEPILLACASRGIDVPKHLSLVTVEAAAPTPFGRAVATVYIPSVAMAQKAVELLDIRIQGGATPTKTVPMVLDPTGTVAPPRMAT